MGKIRSTKRILDFASNFRFGVASVLTPTKRSKQLRKVNMSMTQSDGLYEDRAALGNDFHNAIFNNSRL